MLEHINATLTLYARNGAQLAAIEFSDVGEAILAEYARGILAGTVKFPVRPHYVRFTGRTDEHELGMLTPWWADTIMATRGGITYGPMPFDGQGRAVV